MDEVKHVKFVTPSGRALSSTLASKIPGDEFKISEEQYDQALAVMGVTSFSMAAKVVPGRSGGIIDLDRSNDFIVGAVHEEDMLVFANRHGSFEWPERVSHGHEIWKFHRQDAFLAHEVGQFGGKAIYKIVGSRLNKEPAEQTRVGCCHSRGG
jgi:hypothetical protein